MVIRNLNIKEEMKATLKVLWLVFFLFLYVHVLGCIWWFTAREDEKWIPNKDFYLHNTAYEFEVFSAEKVR